MPIKIDRHPIVEDTAAKLQDHFRERAAQDPRVAAFLGGALEGLAMVNQMDSGLLPRLDKEIRELRISEADLQKAFKPGFTLIELLVVIVILIMIVVVCIQVGARIASLFG